MSRIGKKPITLPKGVSVTVHDQELEVKGPKGTLKTPIPTGVSFKVEGEELRAERASDDIAALHGLGHLAHPGRPPIVDEFIRRHPERSQDIWVLQCRNGTVR